MFTIGLPRPILLPTYPTKEHNTMSSVADLVVKLITEDPSLNHDNERVAAMVRERIPGANTSGASVSSIKSKARKVGLLPSTTSALAELRESTYVPDLELPEETDEERSKRIRTRLSVLKRMGHRVAGGHLPALIVSGPPGLGKSYTVEKVLKDTFGDPVDTFTDEFDEDEPGYDIISGTIAPPGLIISLWKMRKGGVVVLDDCDDVFRDETCLNILKAVLDSSERRIVSYRKEAHWMAEYGIPKSFEFEGSVVFCTNIDFEAAIRKGSNLAPHFEALIDRSLYLSLTMRSQEDFMTRIRQVALEDGLLNSLGLDDESAEEIFEFVYQHKDRFYGLSLRLVGHIASCYLEDPDTWRDDIEATKMRTF